MIWIGGDLNEHVGVKNGEYDKVHMDYEFGTRNDEGKTILDFTIVYKFTLANTF